MQIANQQTANNGLRTGESNKAVEFTAESWAALETHSLT